MLMGDMGWLAGISQVAFNVWCLSVAWDSVPGRAWISESILGSWRLYQGVKFSSRVAR